MDNSSEERNFQDGNHLLMEANTMENIMTESMADTAAITRLMELFILVVLKTKNSTEKGYLSLLTKLVTMVISLMG